jgi:predicted aconitase/predicted aconitase with swiveling domain
MMDNKVKILRGITRVAGEVEGEALVTTEKLSHLANAVGSDGVIRMSGHPLMGQSYAGKIIVYDTDIFSTGGAWGLYFKSRITRTGPLALICRTVHPISVGGAVDARIPAVDGFDLDPCREIKTGDLVKIKAPEAGGEAIVEVHPAAAGTAYGEAAGGKDAPQPAVQAPRTWKKDRLKLAPYEEEMLQGKHGQARQAAMERLVEFGWGMGSTRMVKIRSAHVFSDWKTRGIVIGAWPIYEEFASLGARVAVPTTVESTFMADELVDDQGMPWHYQVKTPAREVYALMQPVHEALKAMGVLVIPTCIPYMHLTPPRFGEAHATSESNHAAYSNIMQGARVNRDPANMVLYAAITGVIPEYGMHLPENRRGQMLFEVDPELLPELQDVGDFVALGGAIGFRAVDRVPVVTGLKQMSNEQAKAFCACVSPALTYPMMHIVGITPEARTVEEAFGGRVPAEVERIRIGKQEVRELFHGIRQTDRRDIDVAVIGCPFLTLQELAGLAELLQGRTVKTRLWLYTDYVVYSAAHKAGILARIEKSGARVVHSCCPGMIDRDSKAAESLVYATDSLKVARLMAGIGWPKNWLGTRRDVVNAAITGKFEPTRWL